MKYRVLGSWQRFPNYGHNVTLCEDAIVCKFFLDRSNVNNRRLINLDGGLFEPLSAGRVFFSSIAQICPESIVTRVIGTEQPIPERKI